MVFHVEQGRAPACAQGACVPRGTHERPGDQGVLAWQASGGRPCPHPPNDQQDRAPGRLQLRAPDCRSADPAQMRGCGARRPSPRAARPRSASEQLSGPGHQGSRRPHRAGAPASSSRAHDPAFAPPQQPPAAVRSVRGIPLLSRPSSACRARPPRGRRGASEGGLSRQSGRCPSSRANSSASSLDDVSSMPGGKRAGCSTWNSPSGGGVGRLERANEPADSQNSGRLAGTPSRRGYRSGHGRVSTSDR